MSESTYQREETEEKMIKEVSGFLSDNLKKIKTVVIICILFLINLFAVSISLQCNRNRGLFSRLIAAIFAFMFGILYIIVNYYMYRIVMNKYPCKICSKNPFPLFG